MRKSIYIILTLMLVFSIKVSAQIALDSVGRNPAYVKTIVNRSESIVKGLNLKNDYARKNVLNIIANRYFKLNDIDDKYKKDKNALQAQLYQHHFEFAADLANYLSDKQIEEIKDGLTYGVTPKTYGAYLEMIPTLKDNEKLQILNWLKEARELAIDAGNSNEKHAWFGKYKGRINNWLSKRGYNLEAERKGWNQRIEAKKNNNE